MRADAAARAVFLDRDGTIIVERDYLSDPDRVEFIAGAIDALRLLRSAGYKLVVVTNQSGIARGLYSEDDYRRVERRVEELLAVHDVAFDAVYFCPHHPDFTGPCDCRKPGLGLYRAAERNQGIDLANSVFVGDRLHDVLPALQLGGRAVLVRTGYGAVESANAPADVEIADDLPDAARRIVGKTRTTA